MTNEESAARLIEEIHDLIHALQGCDKNNPLLETIQEAQAVLTRFVAILSEPPLAWTKTTDNHPVHVPGIMLVPCLSIYRNAIHILVFNHTYNCWEDESGDDIDGAQSDVTWWMPLSAFAIPTNKVQEKQ